MKWGLKVRYPEFEKLSDFAVSFSLDHVNQVILRRAKLIILDSLTAIIHGNRTDEPSKFHRHFASSHSAGVQGVSSILGTHFKHQSHLAAFMNGIGMVNEEMDEGNPIAKGHPSCHFFPAILAAAEASGLSGGALLESFIVGYEAGARAGAAIQLKPSIHPHGNWGMIGAAFAVGKMHRFSSAQIMTALSVGGLFPFASLWDPVLEGHRIRDVYIGLNNLNALLLPDLVRAGYSGELQSISYLFGHLLGERFDISAMANDLGTRYLLMNTYFKFYPYCRFCHSPIDGIVEIMRDEPADPAQIDEVRVFTYSMAARLNGQRMNNAFAGKFSIPYSLAQTILGDKDDPRQIEELAQRIFVHEDPKYTGLLPHQRNARVEVALKNGQIIQREVIGASGDAGSEGLEDQVLNKCGKLLSEVIGSAKASRLIEQVMDLEHIPNVQQLIQTATP